MKCLLPPHQPLDFTSFEDYEVHYQKAHVNRCQECHKNFPSDHYLGLHIAENHDPLNEIKRSRGEKTYACFVSDCDRLCSTPHKRRLHLIDKHQFPKYYDFFVINDGLDKRNSLLRTGHHRRRSSAATTTARSRAASNVNVSVGKSEKSVEEEEKDGEDGSSEEDEDEDEEEMKEGVPESKANETGKSKAKVAADLDSITSSMSALKFVPKSVRFGRGRGRGRAGFAAS
ncbi:uncharacterized protein BDZ99DRAFT_458004 [Mytilinidion resinicola]|uniref:C2H2-type domain-containing protein n=1 Tax=Mytilinidion resinicola TaxID=574789 RepID=A0A6A6Z4M8_9PEZI|nr:uncharacterized protein BDZ99DRAFT_458004 [Mytilinidion resinicola]KAF2816092.1 hypothetical protein BDZ99DRAFT_458004 [Mytilinidion resinicola]